LRIGHKLILVGGSAAGLLIAGFAYFLLESHERQLLGELESHAHQLSETVKSSTRYDMLLNQRESVHQIISSIGRQDAIDKVRIFNKDGEIILSTDSLDIGHMVDMKAEACYACHEADQPLESVPISRRTRIFSFNGGERMLGIISPIYNEASCWQAPCHAHDERQSVLGVLDVTLPLERIDEEHRASTTRIVAISILVMVAISFVMYWLVRHTVIAPVEQLVKATQRVATGDVQFEVAVGTRDEIGRLAESFNDMTQRLTEAQRQLYQSDKLASIGRLAAGVAHEINNPLTGVLTYSSFLQSRLEGQPEFKADLDVIVRETKRCRDIVAGLLDFSRQSSAARRRLDVNELVHVAAGMVRNQLSLQKTRLILDLQQDLPAVNADPGQLQQVLVNLLVNAGDAMPAEGGVISVQTVSRPEAGAEAAASEWVKVIVKDTGAGISPEDRDKIFEPFFSTKGPKGTGLGLAIAWGIIEDHGGRIDLDSAPGKGSTFFVTLPAANHAPDSSHGSASS